jgi:flagellar hook-associated protein 3 FlgL
MSDDEEKMTRVSTYGQMSSTLATAMRLQSEVAKAQKQEGSGQKSENYQGLGSDTRQLLNLENQLARSLEYTDHAEIVSSRVETMYSSVGSMIDEMANLRKMLSSAITNGVAEDIAMNNQAAGILDTFADLANVQVDGRYLFAGNVTNTPPVNVGNPPYAPQTYPSTANTDYYQGDSAIASFKISENRTIDYGVTANESAFEQAIRSLSLAANASENPLDKDAVQEAYDLATQALEGLAVVQTKLSSIGSAIDAEVDIQTEVQLQLEAMASNIEAVDVAEALSRMEALQTQLKASYHAVSILNDMNLFDYL